MKTFNEWILLEKEYQDSNMNALSKLNDALNLQLKIDDINSRSIKLSSLKNAKEKLITNQMYKNLSDVKKTQIQQIFDDPKSTIMSLARIFV